MPGSNWKGVISFGLVTIPVVLYSSQNKKANVSFHQLDKRDNSRIQYQRINAVTGKVVPWKDIIRGYELDKETTIPVPDDILKKVAGEKSREIDIKNFIDEKELDFLTLENVYYLIPDKKGVKAYVILRNCLAETHKAGIAKVIISTKEYLSAVISHDNALILCLLRYDNEIKKLSEFDLPDSNVKKYKITSKEMEIAKKLIKSMSAKWHPEKYKDEYQQSIHQWVDETAHDLPHPSRAKSSRKPTHVVNFVDLLKKSLASTKVKPKRKVIKHKHKHTHSSRAVH